MKTSIPCVLMLFVLASSAIGAEKEKVATAAKNPPKFQSRYVVTLAEYQLEKNLPITATEAEISAFIHDQEIEPFETLKLTGVNDTESSVNFGRTVAVTTGHVSHREGTSRQTSERSIGTVLRIRMAAHERGVIADVSYTCARILGNGTDDSFPNIYNNTVDVTQVFELGKPSLIGANLAEKSTYYFLTIEALP